MQNWKIIATINLPKVVMAAAPITPGNLLPERINIVRSLQQEISQTIAGLTVKLTPWQGTNLPTDFFGPSFEPAMLSLVMEAETPENAILQSEDLLELILDDLSFQLQCAVRVFGLDVLDVTPPISVGMQRQVLSFPLPFGYQSPKFLQAMPLGNVQIAVPPSLESQIQTKDEKIRASLRWYVKALAAPFEVDRFVFCWIALEILCAQSDISVQKPYLARCGHEITNCPECGESTVREVNGATIQKFLVENIGLDARLAKEMWNMRQMFHGSNYLSTKATQDLPRLTIALKFAVAWSLKQALHIPQDQPPIITMEASMINTGFALGGTREITEADL